MDTEAVQKLFISQKNPRSLVGSFKDAVIECIKRLYPNVVYRIASILRNFHKYLIGDYLL